MAVTVTPNLTTMVDCDDLTGNPVAGTWSSSQGSPAAVTDVYREASASIGTEIRGAGVEYVWFTRTSGTWDLSNTHLYIWFMFLFIAILDTKVNGGIRIRVGDGTNWGDWKVGGKDTYGGGWTCLVINTAKAFDYNSGTDPTLTAITQVGVAVNIPSAGRNVETMYLDIIRYGDGITVTSDAPCTLQDIYDYAEADTDGRAFGIMRQGGGVFFLQGKLRLGDASGTDSVEFADTSQIMVFEDKDVASDLYEIIIQGNATGTTSVKFGAKSGGRGISGCVIRSAGTAKYDFTAIDTDIDTLGLYGSIFYDAKDITLPSNSATREVLDCTFEKCGQVVPDTCKVQYCNFISSDSGIDAAVLISDDPHYVTDCSFINCPDAIELDTVGDGDYDFSNLKFTGNTYDVNNTSGSSLTVNKLAGSDPSTSRGSAVSFVGLTQVTFTGMLDNTEVRIYDQGTGEEIAGIEDATDGTTDDRSFAWSDDSGNIVDYVIHNVARAQTIRVEGYTVPTTDTSIPIQQVVERNYANP